MLHMAFVIVGQTSGKRKRRELFPLQTPSDLILLSKQPLNYWVFMQKTKIASDV